MDVKSDPYEVICGNRWYYEVTQLREQASN